MNAKVQRPAVCNAMETLLVDKAIAAQFSAGHRPAARRKAGGIAGRRGCRSHFEMLEMHNIQIRHQTRRPNRIGSPNTTITS